jgi:hypothetical protein
MYKIIQPEVIVGLGEKTEFLEKEAPFKTITKLHIKLEDWLGDDLMECFPCYIITENLKNELIINNFSGYKIKDLEITMSEYFFNNYTLQKPIPKFYWLIIDGIEDKTDIYLGKEKKLFCNDRLINLITSKFNIKYLDINPQRNEFDDLLDQMINESKKNT